eukprot:5832757-Pleurochrysis_carterae.AAC.1
MTRDAKKRAELPDHRWYAKHPRSCEHARTQTRALRLSLFDRVRLVASAGCARPARAHRVPTLLRARSRKVAKVRGEIETRLRRSGSAKAAHDSLQLRRLLKGMLLLIRSSSVKVEARGLVRSLRGRSATTRNCSRCAADEVLPARDTILCDYACLLSFCIFAITHDESP